MISPQQFLIRWVEFSVAGALLLVAVKIAISRLRQPADRINLILMTFVVAAVVPLLMLFLPVPHLQLGLVASKQAVATELPAPLPQGDAPPKATPGAPRENPGHTEAPRFVAYDPAAYRNEPSEPPSITSAPVPTIPLPESASTSNTRKFDPWWFAALGLIIIHGLAIAYFFIETIIGARRLAQLAGQAKPAGKEAALAWREITEGRGDAVRLLVTREISGPLAFGSLRPTIMIPEPIATGDPAVLQFCLKHEWTHIENGDLRAWGITWICQFPLWFQPLFWMLRRDLRIFQDFLADHRAAGDGPARIEYSALLLAFTKRRMGPPIPGAIAFFDQSSQLSRRIHMLLNSTLTLRPRSPRVFCVGAGIVLFTCAALFGAVRLNTADGGAQAAQPEISMSGVQPESAPQETKPSAEKEKKPAEGDNTAAKIIRGSVVDQAGKPVAQAKLCLPLGLRPRRVAQTTADDSGHFELKLPIDWLNKKPRKTRWTLWAYAPGFSFASENVGEVVLGSANELVVKIALPTQEKTSFKILKPNGEPLRDALVQPLHYYTGSSYDYVPEEFLKIIASRTNAEGMATFSTLQQKRLHDMQMTSPSFGHQSILINYSIQEAIRTIRLRATGRIEGKLIADKPEWVRGIHLSFSTNNQDKWTETTGTAEAVTDNEGRYVVPVIASGGPVRLSVGIDRALPVRPRFSDDPYLRGGETMHMDIPLISATLLHGTIQWKSSGKPVANAEISVRHAGNRQLERVKTNEKGYYEARVLPGQIGIHDVDLPNDDMLISPPPPTQKFPLQVPEGALAFELPKIEVVGSRNLTGTLVGEKNEPGSQMEIVALHQGRYYGPRGRCMDLTDPRGRFTVKVPEGMESTFEVFDPKTQQRLPAKVVQKNPLIVRYVVEQPVDPEPERAKSADVTLTGQVLSEGKPLAGVDLTLMRYAKATPIADKNNPKGPASSSSNRVLQTIRSKSDADGRYRLSGLKAGDEYSIDVEAVFPLANLDWKYQSLQTLEEEAKGDITLPDLNLRKWTQTLAGSVVDSDGKPVGGVHIGISLQSQLWIIPRRLKTGSPPWTTTDSTGRFCLENLPDEPLEIVAGIPPDKAQPRARNMAPLAADKNQQNIRIVLNP